MTAIRDAENAPPAKDPLAGQVLMEDYKLWLRELEKQDRWLYQGIWTVLAASAGALYVISGNDDVQVRIAGGIAIGVVALAFIVLNGDFLSTRVSSYRMVSRRVAALRRAAKVYEILGEETYRASGVPMLSDNPEAFVRNAMTGRVRSYRPLLMLHLFALWAVYALLAGFLWHQTGSRWVLFATLLVGLATYVFVATRIRYRASEAENVASFLITLARDHYVRVAPNAEERLLGWMREAQRSTVLKRCPTAIKVIVAYEDRRFWWHPGVDFIAIVGRLLGRRKRGGASTIAMQLARQLIPNPLKGRVRRKIFEAILGTWLVCRYGHESVLAAWLVRVQYGDLRWSASIMRRRSTLEGSPKISTSLMPYCLPSE